MAPESPGVPIVGNDVVDLGAPRASDLSSNARFVERVFSAGERDRLASGDDRKADVWLHWAAKEAAYKVVSKLRGEPPIFVHRAFEVRWLGGTRPATSVGSPEGPSRRGAVRYEDVSLPVVAAASPDGGYVHALSWQALEGDAGAAAGPRGSRWTVEQLDRPGAPWSEGLEALASQLTEWERDGVHSRPSAAVRIGARADAARMLRVDPVRIEIVCRPGRTGRRPPTLLVDGAPASIDVSLSHDGPWIAWALSPADPAGPSHDIGTRKS